VTAKAVFTDLDGTLLDEQGVSPGTRDALDGLRARGIPVFVATGRSVCATAVARVSNPFICYTAPSCTTGTGSGCTRDDDV
jgi:HAD superfamily hydrolase (TIGR01484 family)